MRTAVLLSFIGGLLAGFVFEAVRPVGLAWAQAFLAPAQVNGCIYNSDSSDTLGSAADVVSL